MHFQEVQLEFTARCMINGTIVAASEKGLSNFITSFCRRHIIFLFLPFMTDVAIVEVNYTNYTARFKGPRVLEKNRLNSHQLQLI